MDVQRSQQRRSGSSMGLLRLTGLLLAVLLLTPALPAAAAPQAQSGRVTLNMAASPLELNAGGTVSVSVRVNNGTAAQVDLNALNVTFGALPAGGIVIEAATGDFACEPPDTASVTCSGGLVPAGATASLNVAVRTVAGAGGNLGGNASLSYTAGGQNGGASGAVNVTVNAAAPGPPTNTTAPLPAATDTPLPPAPTSTRAVTLPPAAATDTTVPPPPPATSTALPPVPLPPTATRPAEQPQQREQPQPPQPQERERPEPTEQGRAQPPTAEVSTQSGLINGRVVRGGTPAAGVGVELHLKTGGSDTFAAAATTNGDGFYSFSGLPAPAGGFYYVFYSGRGKSGEIDSWYTRDVGYNGANQVTVPTFNVADLSLVNATVGEVTGNHTLLLSPRSPDETYLLRIARWNALDRPVLDVGAISGGSYTVDTTKLPGTAYHGLLQIVSPTGNGFPQSRFRFTVKQQTAPGIPTLVPGANVLLLNLKANKAQLVTGETVIYTLDAVNNSSAALTNVTLNLVLAGGQTLDLLNTAATAGNVSYSGNTVTLRIAQLNPGQTATLTTFAAAQLTEDFSIVNYATASYDQFGAPLRSNDLGVQIFSANGRPAPVGVQPTNTRVRPAPTATRTGGRPPIKATTVGAVKPTAKATPKPGTGRPTIPQTGGDFPYWMLLPITVALAVLVAARTTRLRRRANARVE